MKLSNHTRLILFLVLSLFAFSSDVANFCLAQHDSDIQYDSSEGDDHKPAWDESETRQADSGNGGFGFFLLRAMIFGTITALLLFFERRNEQPLSPFSEASMLENRVKPENSRYKNLSDEERNDKANALGKEIIGLWTTVPQNPDTCTITRRSQAAGTKAKINEIAELSPTSPQVLKDVNDMIEIYNVQTQRHSVASRPVVTLVVLFILAFTVIGFLAGVPWFALGFACDLTAYLVAARAPLYLIQNGWFIAPSG